MRPRNNQAVNLCAECEKSVRGGGVVCVGCGRAYHLSCPSGITRVEHRPGDPCPKCLKALRARRKAAPPAFRKTLKGETLVYSEESMTYEKQDTQERTIAALQESVSRLGGVVDDVEEVEGNKAAVRVRSGQKSVDAVERGLLREGWNVEACFGPGAMILIVSVVTPEFGISRCGCGTVGSFPDYQKGMCEDCYASWATKLREISWGHDFFSRKE